MRQSLTILQINDLHGYLEPHAETIREGDHVAWRTLGGLARIATAFEDVRKQRENVIALDNGDTFHGTYVPVQSKGEAMIPLMNALELDAMTVHWEFAYGPQGVRHLASKLHYPILAINCYDKTSGELVFPPYRMLERSGMRIAVIGIACVIVDKTMPPSFSEGVRFSLGRDELPGWINHVRQQERADLVVVLSHLGFPQDVKLASEVDGIDVLVSGHTHNRMHTPVIENGAIIFQSGCHGSFIGVLDLELENGTISSHRHRLLPIDDRIAADENMQRMVDAALDPHRPMLSEIVGSTEVGLDRYSMLDASMDNVLLDAIAAAAGVDIAFSNGWRYGAPIPPGPITMNDLWNMIPTNPAVSTVELTGTEIRQMLEENLERTFAGDAYKQMGGYVKRCRGLDLYIKIENPTGHRIDRIFAEGAPLEPERMYKAAFVTAQGVPQKFGRNRQALPIKAIDALRAHLARGPIRQETLRHPVKAV